MYVYGFPTICRSLVLIPSAVIVRGSPLSLPQLILHRCVHNSLRISPSYLPLFQNMVPLNETFQIAVVYVLYFCCFPF
ncbi:hypothetical protein F5J12DRAFT_850655 [Pisolithus orientalis]|uniref:uncharacterized protein n=1 Tax=Pisolithus orientalis TaxID=936130 RepID=UPI0022251842|nr:uncharacterized protein F5J12DRAFT_850655 [Pisolithus orientalis]KAI5997837.1 hypothetical protein F5J12DRAFT_850655 [Pisolithus orientalis]